MKSTTKDKIKAITPEGLLRFRVHAFAPFAIGSNANGRCQLGVNSFGKYEVRFPNGEELTFDFAAQAIEEFQKLLQ